MHDHLTCNHSDDDLQDLLDNLLTGDDRRDAEALVLECSSCRDFFFSLRELTTELRRLPADKAPKAFVANTMDLIRKEDRKKRPLQVLAGIAAALVILFGISMTIGTAENVTDADGLPEAALVVEVDGSVPLQADGWAIGGVSLALVGSAFLLKRLVEPDGSVA